MTKKKNTLLNEHVIRRWGKLANMPALTENWLGEQDDLEDEAFAAEDEAAAGEAEMEAGVEGELEAEAEVSPEEEAAVARIVNAVVDAIADETGVAIEVEEDGDEAAMDDMDADVAAADEYADEAAGEMEEEDPAAAMRDPYNRKDITERGDKSGDEGAGKDEDDKDYSGKGMRKGDKSKTHAGVDETIDLDVIDDENLTEAVLKRVVERLLRARRK